MRLRGLMAGMVLAACLTGAAQAEKIKAEIKFEGSGIPAMSKEAQGQIASTVSAALQSSLAKWLRVQAFDSSGGGTVVFINLRGEWDARGIPSENAEQLRKLALAAAATVPEAKLAIADFRIAVEDVSRPAPEERDQDEDLAKANRVKARPQARLDIDVKDKLIADLTILDVPLVRAMDRLGAVLPVAYVMSPDVVGRPVYVRLMGVTLEEALAAIAESAKVKIERREKYVAFVPLPPPGK